MAAALFPDNTVLCNFASIGRVSLLRDWLRGRGRWTDGVELEARKSAEHLPHLHEVFIDGWLGEAIEPTPEEEARIRSIRRVVFGGTEDAPLEHLGEATTCHLIRTRSEFSDAWWITDDRAAYDYAKRQTIIVRDTCDIFSDLIAEGELTPDNAFALLTAMSERDRGVRLPPSANDLLM